MELSEHGQRKSVHEVAIEVSVAVEGDDTFGVKGRRQCARQGDAAKDVFARNH